MYDSVSGHVKWHVIRPQTVALYTPQTKFFAWRFLTCAVQAQEMSSILIQTQDCLKSVALKMFLGQISLY